MEDIEPNKLGVNVYKFQCMSKWNGLEFKMVGKLVSLSSNKCVQPYPYVYWVALSIFGLFIFVKCVFSFSCQSYENLLIFTGSQQMQMRILWERMKSWLYRFVSSLNFIHLIPVHFFSVSDCDNECNRRVPCSLLFNSFSGCLAVHLIYFFYRERFCETEVFCSNIQNNKPS